MRFRVWIASIFPVSASAPALIAIPIPHCRPARFDRCERNGQLGSTHIELNALHVRLPTGALPEKLRLPLVLHFGLGMTHQEVGQALGCPPTTAQSRLEQGLARLRRAFVGAGAAMNTLALADANGGAVIRGTAGPVLLHHRGEGLVLGVRPEAINLGGEHGIPAAIESVEFLGADSLVTCMIGSERLTARVAGRLAADRGIVLQLSWRPEEAHLFDASDGRRRDDLAPLIAGAAQRLDLVR